MIRTADLGPFVGASKNTLRISLRDLFLIIVTLVWTQTNIPNIFRGIHGMGCPLHVINIYI